MELQIFKNEQFGEVRTATIDNQNSRFKQSS